MSWYIACLAMLQLKLSVIYYRVPLPSFSYIGIRLAVFVLYELLRLVAFSSFKKPLLCCTNIQLLVQSVQTNVLTTNSYLALRCMSWFLLCSVLSCSYLLCSALLYFVTFRDVTWGDATFCHVMLCFVTFLLCYPPIYSFTYSMMRRSIDAQIYWFIDLLFFFPSDH